MTNKEILESMVKEAQKIPEICDDYIMHCNCEYSEGYCYGNNNYIEDPQYCRDCPKICPKYKEYKLNKSEVKEDEEDE